MSYDLAVREGERPADDKTTGPVFSNLYDCHIDGEVDLRPNASRLTWPRSLSGRATH